MRLAPVRLSVRSRLAVIYTGLLTVVLVAFGSGIYVVLRDELVRSFDGSLLANVQHAAGAFALDLDAGGLLKPSERLVDQLASTGGRVIVLDPVGTVLADSDPTTVPGVSAGPTDLGHLHQIQQAVIDGETIRWTMEPIAGPDGTTTGYVLWAASTASLEDLLATVGRALILGGLTVVGMALILGLVLARRALAPISDVTETARAISLSGDVAARVDAGSSRDEVGELAVAFNEMLGALEENQRALQRFLADASHELRTPLTTIRASLELSGRPGVPEEERMSMLSDASEEVERMGRLVSDLLSLARAESGYRFETRPVELDTLLLECVRRQRKGADSVDLAVGAVEPAVVAGDEDRLRELLGIVLDNAVRYTPAGGRVRAELAVRGHDAIVRIYDTGIGLDPEDRDRVFERLFRGERARRMRPSGTGLGLAIARWIADQHGGSISLDRGPEAGTVATVTLPVSRP